MTHERRQILSFVASFPNDYFHNVHEFLSLMLLALLGGMQLLMDLILSSGFSIRSRAVSIAREQKLPKCTG